MSSDDTNGSLWKETAAESFSAEPLDGDQEFDVVIVGGGFTGLRAALHLAGVGTSVAVLEARDVGWGASGRSGGQVNPLLPVANPEQLRRTVGDRYFERLAEVSRDSADALFALVRQCQIQCDARQNGWLRVDHCARARQAARDAALAWGNYGYRFDLVEGADVGRLSGSLAYRSGILWPSGGAVQPLSLALGLARVAAANGARIFKKAPVHAMHRERNSWSLQCGAHRIRANWVILAANGYTDVLTPRIRRSILPLTPIQIATGPLAREVIDAILPGGLTIADTRRVIMYARREPDDRLVYGGIGYRLPNGRVHGFEWLRRDAVRVFPALAGVKPAHRWSGQIALTSDRIPHFHEPAPGLIAGLGYNGRGVAISLVMGRVLAERALGKAPEDLPFPVSPIKPVPFRGIQRAGVGAMIQVMRALDRIETAIAP